eukprot:UN02190
MNQVNERNETVYNIRAELNNNIFTVMMSDEGNPNKYEQQFTQSHFPNMELFDVARTVVDAINNTIKNTAGAPKIACKEFNGMAYVSVSGSMIGTLVLSPKITKNNKIAQTQLQQSQPTTPTATTPTTTTPKACTYELAYVLFQKMIGNKPFQYGMYCYVGTGYKSRDQST